jgi:hypothetical protein
MGKSPTCYGTMNNQWLRQSGHQGIYCTCEMVKLPIPTHCITTSKMCNSIQAKLPFQNALSQSWLGSDPGNKLTVRFVLLPFFLPAKVCTACTASWMGTTAILHIGGKKKTSTI